MHYNVAKPTCSIFRVTTANFSGVRIFRNFTVIFLLIAGCEYLVQYWWHTAAVGRPHCQGPDHARLSVYQAVWSRNEGMGGKTCYDAGYPRWMVEGWRYSLHSKKRILHECSVVLNLSRLTTKPTKWHVRPTKTRISLGIRPVWSESSLSAWRKLGCWATHWVHSEDSDQTGWMPRLISVFAGRRCHFVGFVLRQLIYWVWEKQPDLWLCWASE